MHDIERAIADAWHKQLRPRLERDPAELRRRLSRRGSRLINQPPRAWCIAIRASDTRLAEFTCSSAHPFTPSRHDILLTSYDLKGLCSPVRLTPPGEPLRDVMDKLGLATPAGLLNARLAGVFHTRYLPALDGVWGKPHPLLYTDKPLDPAARLFATDDPVWAATARDLPGRIPRNISATLTRVANYRSTVPAGRYDDTAHLHPEHPHVDRPHQYKSKKLPPPPPDYVPYKWKGEQYVGYDWRSAETNPAIRINYERHQRQLECARAAAKRRRRENPPPSKPAGSLQFRGYQWLCPCCARQVNILYFPLPRVHLLPGKLPALAKRALRGKPSSPVHPSSLRLHPSIPRFACEKCHKIRRQSRTDPNAWNEIITYLTAGLLYGREVQRPAWFPHVKQSTRYTTQPSTIHHPRSTHRDRKIAYTPRPTRDPGKRRPQIENLLLSGQTFKQIAAALKIAYGTVLWHAQQVYKHHGVRTLPDLLRKHGQNIPPPMTKEVRRRLLAGQTIAQIEQEIGAGKTLIYNQRQQLRKHGHKLPVGREHNRLGGRQRMPI